LLGAFFSFLSFFSQVSQHGDADGMVGGISFAFDNGAIGGKGMGRSEESFPHPFPWVRMCGTAPPLPPPFTMLGFCSLSSSFLFEPSVIS